MNVESLNSPSFALSCPLPKTDYDRINMAHGGGGRLSQDLFQKIFLPAFSNPVLAQQTDGANLDIIDHHLTITTDAYVVRPIFFPGGDIGRLAIHGTVNDLAVCGARPVAISASFILEEGLEVESLWRIVSSMRDAMEEAVPGLRIVCGDTKVVERPAADSSIASEPALMISTTGIGERLRSPPPLPSRISAGDAILISGPIGDHGMAVMSVREGLEFESPILSDSQSLWSLVEVLMNAAEIHCMRDPTRGGISSALNELARSSGLCFYIDESAVPVRQSVAAACEILGFDPMYVACEGRLIAFVHGGHAQKALTAMRIHRSGAESAIIGRVEKTEYAEVIVRTAFGAERPLEMLSGEQLPRIC